MSLKTICFGLFLYTSLGWVGVAYWKLDARSGWFWTAMGLIATLLYLIVMRILGWWKLRRARAAAAPPRSLPKPAAPVPEEVSALRALLAEANQALAQSAYQGGRVRIKDLPVYLLVGPEGSGKTSNFNAAGLEPVLLAGQSGPLSGLSSSRIGNIWLARNSIFIELSGRVFSGDATRWTELLEVIRGTTLVPLWRRLWGEMPTSVHVKAAIAFCDMKEFTSGSADVQRFERLSRTWLERLRAIANVFGDQIPVYQLVTKCDAVPYFAEFFRRLPEPEAAQVFGCTLPYRETIPAQTNYMEAEGKRLIGTFRSLYQSLAARRIWHLLHEPEASARPAVYEFPRELKRIRNPLAQFLTDSFRPHLMGSSPILRGYYFTGLRHVESASAQNRPAEWSGTILENTRAFRPEDATQIFRMDDIAGASTKMERRNLTARWSFVTDLFSLVILPDQPPRRIVPVDGKAERMRQYVFGSVCAVCALACLIFIYSWIGNRSLLRSVEASSLASVAPTGQAATLADLQALDQLREQVKRMRDGVGIGLHWGLYSGDRIFDEARAAYFRRFQRLLLNELNGGLVQRLSVANPAVDAFPAVYDGVRTHLSISSGACSADSVMVARVLKDQARTTFASQVGRDWMRLADQQVEFYASELAYGNPCRLAEDATAREHARDYLRKGAGIDAFYGAMLVEATRSAKTLRLEDSSPTWRQALAGPSEMTVPFTPEGWAFVEKKSKDYRGQSLDTCVMGGSAGSTSGADTIRQRFAADYSEAWRKYIAGFSVLPYRGPEDAGRKLDLLADRKSPLLALLAMVANQTNVAQQQAQAGGIIDTIQPVATKAAKALGFGKEAVPQIVKPPSIIDLTAAFQPVYWVVPPGSDNWVQERNQPYLDGLSHLAQSMHALGGAKGSDQAVVDEANQNYRKALDAVQQLARGFKSVGSSGLDESVQHLLSEPITAVTIPHIDPGGPANRGLQGLCSKLGPLLHKFPFVSGTDKDVSLQEFTALFGPTGAIAAFRDASLAEFIVKEGGQWKVKDPTKKPQITPDMLAFVNHAQHITDGFFADGSPTPSLSYNLRPKLVQAYKGLNVEVKIDGKTEVWKEGQQLQKTFHWPAKDLSQAGADGRLTNAEGSPLVAFGSQGGLWAIFRLMAEADPRPAEQEWVEWSRVRSGNGREQKITPVRLDIPGQGDARVFDPKLFLGVQCPRKAVE